MNNEFNPNTSVSPEAIASQAETVTENEPPSPVFPSEATPEPSATESVPNEVSAEPSAEPSIEAILETIPEVAEPKPHEAHRKSSIVVVPAWEEAVEDHVAHEAEVATEEYKIELNPPITKAIYAVKRKAVKVFTALITPDEEEIEEDLSADD